MSTVSGTSTSTSTQTAAPAAPVTPVIPVQASAQLVTADLYGIFVTIFGVVLSLIVLITTGSFFAVLVLWTVVALIVTVLFYYGFIDLERILGAKTTTSVTPSPSFVPSGGPLVGSEVFHISQNQFTYDEAPAVCAAFGAQLASLEQIIEAYNAGAEWCGYGWSAGGMALYPTQKKTWEELQREVDPGKRTACGRPGVNGGYFDPSLKFGVNCFGFKPAGEFTPPAPLPGTDRQKFDSMVNKFKEMIKTLKLDPFSRSEWSAQPIVNQGRKLVEGFTSGIVDFVPSYGGQFTQNLGKLVENMESADPAYVEAAKPGGPYAPNGPFGLRGDKGDKGDKGETGPKGDTGPVGATGPKGDTGPVGATGPAGVNGIAGNTIGQNDYVWAVNSRNEIYRCKAPCTSGSWERIQGALKQIDVGKEYVYGANTSDQLYRCRLPCDTGAWELVSGSAKVISG